MFCKRTLKETPAPRAHHQPVTIAADSWALGFATSLYGRPVGASARQMASLAKAFVEAHNALGLLKA
jgi:hypothetical protein